MKLVKDAYKSWNAEVVFITSNYQGNQEITEGCKEAGIPVFVSHSPQRSCLPYSDSSFPSREPSGISDRLILKKLFFKYNNSRNYFDFSNDLSFFLIYVNFFE